MHPLTIVAGALGLGIGVAVVAGPKNKGLIKRFPDAALKVKVPSNLNTFNTPIHNPNIELASGTGHAKLPTLAELAAVTAKARFHTPLDGPDGKGGAWRNPVTESAALKSKGLAQVLAWGDGEGGAAAAREELFAALLEAIDVGLARQASSDPLKLLIDGNSGYSSGAIVAWTLAYMASPGLGDLRSRVARMFVATQQLIHRPTAKQYMDGEWFDQSWMADGSGISMATGKQSVRKASVALVMVPLAGGPIGYVMWQTEQQAELTMLVHDWRALFGDPQLTIETATQNQLMNLAVSLGVLYFQIAADKTAQWSLGPPSKVDTWGNIKKAFAGVLSAGVAAFSGNYVGVLNAALTASGNQPIPGKVAAILNAAGDTLSSWA